MWVYDNFVLINKNIIAINILKTKRLDHLADIDHILIYFFDYQ